MLNPFALQAAFSLDFMQGALPLGVTLTRASTATYFDAAGVLQSAAIDTARFDHDPKTLANTGMLYEHAAATNLVLQSTPATAGVWGSFGLIGLTTGQPGKGGATSSTKLVPTASGSNTYRIRENFTWTAEEHTVSFDVKSAGLTWARILFNDGSGPSAWFNIAAGTLGSVQGTGVTHTITDIGGGFYRITMTDVAGAGAGLIELYLTGGDGPANIALDPNGVDGIYVENGQVEVGGKATSRIFTTVAQVTRSADVLTITIPAGVDVIRVTHDDDSYTEFQVAAGPFVVPTLGRPWIKSIVARPTLPATFKPAATAMATADLFAGGNVDDLNSVTRHYFPYGCDWLEIGVANWFVDAPTSALAEAGPGFPMTVATSVTMPDGRVVKAPWGGADTGTLASGADGYSDKVFVGLAGPGWLKFNTYRKLVGSRRGLVTQTASDTANGEKLYSFNGAGNLTMSPDAIVDNIGSTYRAPPMMIRGNVNGRAFVLIGDSTQEGAQDAGATSDHGIISRALNNRWPYLNMGVGNDQLQKFLLSNAKRLALAVQFTDCIENYCINDVAAGARSAAQLLADGVTFRALLPGLTHWKPTPHPFGVASSDGYTTLVGQTVYANDAVRVTFSTALRAGVAGVTVLEYADAVESARNSGKFRVDLGALTGDGTHGNALCNSTGSAAVQASIN
jgi:hypothetical protein